MTPKVEFHFDFGSPNAYLSHLVIPAIEHMSALTKVVDNKYGFKPSFNQTFEDPKSSTGWWVSPYHFGIDQGPVILMIENHRTGLIWDIMRRSPYIKEGLRRAGFRGGWLDG